ncbi:D-alanyl-D-alanine carboxypeptidase DacB precursor [Hungatella hathewayi]
MALIARAALNYSEIVEIMGTRVYKIPPSQKAPEGQTISPGHKMLKKNDAAYDSRVFGGKTGFTSLAGNTLVTYAKKDDMTLIAVILNGHQTHYTDTKKLLDFGFSRFQSMKLTDYEGSLVPENHLTYSDSNTDQSLLLLNQNSRIVLPKEADLSAVVPIVSYDETPLTPSGTVVTVNYLYGERTVGHAWISPNPAVRSRLTRSAVPEGLSDQAAPGGRFRMNLSRGWLLAAGAAAALAAVVCGILFFLKRQKIREARVAAVRKHRREQWMQESGCSAEEFEALLAKRKGSSGKKRRH